MKKLQVLSSQFQGTTVLSNWKNANREIIPIDDWRNIDTSIPVYCHSDLTHEHVRQWLNQKQPAIYGGRGYVGNHLFKQRWLSRMSVNGWADTILQPVPYSRWDLMKLTKHPWKVKEVKRVLIAPSKMTSRFWTPELEDRWAASIIDKFPGAEVKIRYKPGKPGARWATLWEDFDWADLVVSQSSAITVEAFWYGKKVLSTEPCTTWAAHRTTFDDWNDPTEPALRNLWHEHIAWHQFTDNEFTSGEFLNLLEQYLGPVIEYNPQYTYTIKI